jgi:H+/Cl- antiporter ClcA
MDVWKVVLRLWALLSLLSLVIDAICIGLDLNGRAAAPLHDLYETYRVSHVTVFLFSAPAPFVLAVIMPLLGVLLIFIRWSVGIEAPGARPRKTPQIAATIERKRRGRSGVAARRNAA